MDAICKADYDNRVKAKEAAEKEVKQNPAVKVPQVGFHDIYGAWFYGKLCAVIHQIQLSRFGVDQEKWMHVFVDIEPGKIADGIHEISVYGRQCRLFKWAAQGYHRGLVVLADDLPGCATAQVYMESRTWSWVLKDEDKAKLPHEVGNDERYRR